MSYQFELNQSNRSLRFPVILMAGIVCTVIAAYAFAACGDRNPDQARASEPVGSTTSTTVPVSTGKPALVISGPVTFELADSAYRGRRYDDATVLFKTYTESRPNNAWGFYMLGLSAWKSGDREQAESAFVQALTLDSTHVKSHLNLSRVLLESGQPDSALVHIEAAIARALRPEFRASLEGMLNPYGDGHAGERIAGVLARVPLGEALLQKRAATID